MALSGTITSLVRPMSTLAVNRNPLVSAQGFVILQRNSGASSSDVPPPSRTFSTTAQMAPVSALSVYPVGRCISGGGGGATAIGCIGAERIAKFSGDLILPLKIQPAHSLEPAFSNASHEGHPRPLSVRSATLRSNIASVSPGVYVLYPLLR